MLPGSLRRNFIPSLKICGPARGSGLEIARGGSAHDNQKFSAAERQNRRRERMPHLLADQQTHTAKARVERAQIGPGLHETRLVENPVGWREHLPVNVPHRPRTVPGFQINHTVVKPSPPALVEADYDVRRVFRRRAKQFDQRIDRQRGLCDTTLQEVPT